MEKVNLVPEFLEIATSYTFGSFQACFLSQFHVDSSIKKVSLNY